MLSESMSTTKESKIISGAQHLAAPSVGRVGTKFSIKSLIFI
jgi:hypothetical protein